MKKTLQILFFSYILFFMQACHEPGDLPAADAVAAGQITCSVDGKCDYALVHCEIASNLFFNQYKFVYAKDNFFTDPHSLELHSASSHLPDTILGLESDCTYYYYIEVTDLIGSARLAVDTFCTTPRALPVVMTDSLYLLSAQLHCLGSYLPDAESPVSDFGFYWSNDSANFAANAICIPANVLTTDTLVHFLASITNLQTYTYYVKAYATNVAGTSYGRMLSCSYTRLQVSTDSIKDVKQTTCTLYGTVVEKGSEECQMVRTGFCLSEHPIPTTDDIVVESIRPIQHGPYSCEVSGLNSGTIYYVRAFAHTRSLTGVETIAYGEEMEMMTMEALTVILYPIEESVITPQYVLMEGEVTCGGGASIKERGFLWIRLTLGQNPTIFNCDGKHPCDLGTNGLGIFSDMVTGFSTNEKYVVRAYVIASDDSVVYSESQTITIPDGK